MLQGIPDVILHEIMQFAVNEQQIREAKQEIENARAEIEAERIEIQKIKSMFVFPDENFRKLQQLDQIVGAFGKPNEQSPEHIRELYLQTKKKFLKNINKKMLQSDFRWAYLFIEDDSIREKTFKTEWARNLAKLMPNLVMVIMNDHHDVLWKV